MARKFPHLLREDATIWQRFLDRFPDRYNSILYDVRVGQGREPDPDLHPSIRRMAADLSVRRIDAVGVTDDHLDIIEITGTIGLTAIGQVITYPILYQLTFNPDTPLRGLIVAEAVQSDIQPVIDALQIDAYLV